MKKISFLISVVFFLSGALHAAEIRSTVGTVEVKKAGDSAWTQGRPKTDLGDGDIVRTGVGSQTEIQMKEGHKMTLREKTTLKVDSGEGPETTFDLVMGRLRAFVSKLRPQNKFQIKTPVAVASVRGTLFEMDVTDAGASRLSVLEGIVSYRDLAGLGEEVRVFQGQSVVVEPGAAPRPPEPLPQELRQGFIPDQQQKTAAFNLKAEIQRETGLASFKEFFQSDAAAEMKTAQYQEGKTLVDAFGKRVRLEEYIVRPQSNQFSFVSLNTRESRFDFTRFDLYAKNALPDDLGSINLFSSNQTDGLNKQGNWVEKTHRLSSNGSDYYREWQDGGTPVNMNNGTQRVVFDHWYTEVRGDSGPVLLSHWKPNSDFKPNNGLGNPNATKTRDDADVKADLLQDIPSGYEDFGAGAIGDSRKVQTDGFTDAQRLDYFNNATVAASYAVSEGFPRTSRPLFDDKTFSSLTLTQILNATKVSRQSTYDVPGTSSDITLQVDQYNIDDDGDRLTFFQAATLGSDVQGINFQSVFTSSELGNRDIDVVVSPAIFKKAGLLDN